MGKERASLTVTHLRLAQTSAIIFFCWWKSHLMDAQPHYTSLWDYLGVKGPVIVSEGFVQWDMQSTIFSIISNLFRPNQRRGVCRAQQTSPGVVCLWCHRQQGTSSPGTFPWQIGSLLSPSRPQMRTEEHSPPGRRHPRLRRYLHKEVMGEELTAPLPTSLLTVMDASPTMDRKEKVHPREGHL